VNSELFQETVQASVDMDIPIIVVDRLKYAQSEAQKISECIKRFIGNENAVDLNYIITNYCNNMVGCAYYEDQEISEYHKFFNEKGVLSLIFDLYDHLEKNGKEDLILFLRETVSKERQMVNNLIFDYYTQSKDEIKKELKEEISNIPIENMKEELQEICQKVENDDYTNFCAQQKG